MYCGQTNTFELFGCEKRVYVKRTPEGVLKKPKSTLVTEILSFT